MYLEGVNDGEKLYRQVREINRVKPVISGRRDLLIMVQGRLLSLYGFIGRARGRLARFFAQTGSVAVFSWKRWLETAMSFSI
jgi:hypothetical protein